MNTFELDLLNHYIESVNKIISLFTWNFPDELFQQIEQALNTLGDSWNRCFSGRCSFEEFKANLSRLHELYKQGAELYRPDYILENPQPIKGQKRLTRKQRLFIEYYIKYGVGAKAARLAGYSARSAKKIAFINLRKPRIKALINKELKTKNNT